MSKNSKLTTATLAKGQHQIIIVFLGVALSLFVLTLTVGFLSASYYSRTFAEAAGLGLPFQMLRSMHASGAFSWIFAGSVTVVLHFLFTMIRKDETLLAQHGSKLLAQAKMQLGLWLVAGLIGFVSLALEVYSGREYVVFPPVSSLLILVGWLLYAKSFFQIIGFNLKKQPVYVWMWAVSIFLFIFSFLEAHLYLLPYYKTLPMRDMAIQWKSYGSLIGSFNLIVYGALIYLSEQLSNNKEYAHSNTAFFLFLLGILNSFTNYAHHTYHLPQSLLVKIIAFVISMLEIIVLFKVLLEILGLKEMRAIKDKYPEIVFFISATTIWTFIQLVISILISIPNFNAWVHGTFVILAHSMGTTIGIDSMALLATTAFLLRHYHKNSGNVHFRWRVPGLVLNVGLLGLWLNLLYEGFRASISRVDEQVIPSYLTNTDHFATVFLLSGLLMLVGALWLIIQWWRDSQVFSQHPEPNAK